jgi:hypothetical protein
MASCWLIFIKFTEKIIRRAPVQVRTLQEAGFHNSPAPGVPGAARTKTMSLDARHGTPVPSLYLFLTADAYASRRGLATQWRK